MERYIFIRRMFYFLELCDKRSTGSRKELANKLDMSESSIKRMINDLRDAGMDVRFDYGFRSYIRS